MTESDRGLAERQRSVVELLRGGQTDQQIAAVLDVSQRTISSEVATIMQVFGVCSRFALGFSIGASTHATETAV